MTRVGGRRESVAFVILALAITGCGTGGATGGTASSAASGTPAAALSVAPSAAPSVAPTSAATAAPTPVPSDGQTAGEVRTDPWGIEQVWVPAGSFRMGTGQKAIDALSIDGPPDWVATEFPSEQPAHDVRLTHGYWIDRTEVTNAAFAAFVEAGGYTYPGLWSDDGLVWLAVQDVNRLPLHCQGNVPEHPRLCVTWHEAQAYAAWRAGRLPTEAEWEYAARGPDSSIYPYGDTFEVDKANVISSLGPKAVGNYPDGASWVGALDMSGNAMEWVADWLDAGYYATSPADDPTGPATGARKVEKGGWWGSNEFVARSAYRHYEDPPEYGDKHIGFRIASQ